VVNVSDLEAALAAAKLDAARCGSRVIVYTAGREAAIVWPDGRIDIQSPGAALIASRPPA
jgi:hypothetical protein